MEPGRAGSVPLNMLNARGEGWLTAGRLDDLPQTLFFHARDKLAVSLCRGAFKLHGALADHAHRQGWGVEVLPYSRAAAETALANSNHLHVFLEDRPIYAPNALHSVPAYLRGYWYVDELGTRNNSSNRLRRFDSRAVAEAFAERFHARISTQFIDANFSKFEQLPRQSGTIITGSLVFFAQDFLIPRWHKHYLTVPQMIDAAVRCKGQRALYIKAHPNQSISELAELSGFHDPENGVFLSDSSIHDLLAACDCALTLTSAVGFEAFLHRKPVVLGGQTDFGQNAITLTDPTKLADAIAAATARDWPYAKFVTWFLKQNCFEDHPRALPDLLALIHAKGISLGDAAGQGFY